MWRAKMWYDELTADTPRTLFQQVKALADIETRYPPLLYFLGSFACLVIGYSTDTLVLTSTLLFLAIIVGMYFISRLLFDQWRALFVAFITSFLPVLHGFSRSFSTDYLAAAIVVWAMYTLLKSDYYRDRKWVIAFSVLNGLGFLARPTAFLFYLAPCAVVVVCGFLEALRREPGGRARSRDMFAFVANAALTVVVTLAIALPWYLYHLESIALFWNSYREGQAIFTFSGHPGRLCWFALLAFVIGAVLWRTKRVTRERLAAVAAPALFGALAFMIVVLKQERWSIYPICVINNGVFLPVFVFGVGGTLLVCRRTHRKFPFVMTVLWVLGSYVLMTAVLRGTAPRYILPAMPAFGLLAAAAVYALQRERLRRIAAFSLAAVLLFQYGNLALVPYGKFRKAELPILSNNHHVRYFFDSGLVLYKDQIVSGSYLLCPPYTEENHIDRIFNAMAEDDAGNRLGYAAYQWLKIIGGGFRRGKHRLEVNPFLRWGFKMREAPQSRPFQQVGDLNKNIEDLSPRLAETDYVAFRLNNRQLDRQPQWERFFKREGFRTIDQFDATRHDMSPYGSRITVMSRRKPLERKVVERWDFAELEKSQWEWHFFEGSEKTPKGAAGPAEKSGPWVMLTNMNLDAGSVTGVRVRIALTQTTDFGNVRVPLRECILYWARSEHIEADRWPFSDFRAIPFRNRRANPADVLEASVALHDEWHGTIGRVFIGIGLPDRSERVTDGPVSVQLQEVAFLQ